MLRGGEGARRGPRIDRMGGLVLAMVVGVLVPPLLVSVLASRDPLPRDCGSGQVSSTRLDGAILRTGGADLWYSEGYPGQPRKLLDFAPHPARLTPTPSGTSAAPSPSAASPAASPEASPGASPGPPPAPSPRVVAADIAADRRLVAVLVIDPPDRPGFISMRMLSPLDPGGKPPVEGWYAPYDPHPQQPPLIRVLDNNRVLLVAGIPRANLPAPTPAVSPDPSPSPTPVASPVPSPSPLPSASPSGSTPATPPATPPASPAAPPPAGGEVVVVVDPGTAVAVDQAPLDYFLTLAHSKWADTKSFRVAPALPTLSARANGSISRVAGTVGREVVSPLARRRLNQVVIGTAGRSDTTVLCAAAPGTVPLMFSPDETGLALLDRGETLVIDLSGVHAATRLLDGRILAWRA